MTDTGARLSAALAGRYRMERVLGTGGMATVYLATDLRHDRPVAVKVLKPGVAGTVGADRFLHEIRIAARLTHPNILPLHDSGRADDLLYYVMPYVEGHSLRGILNDRKQLPIDEAVRIAGEISDALAYAHAQGVVHRDIKPANILIEDGQAVVCDFGIAKAIAVAGDSQLSQKGIAVGTPAYMSPEQATGEQEIDGRSDIYALGCLLYEMLVGEPPFSGPTPMAIMARHAVTPPPSLRTVRDSVPQWLEAAVHRALRKSAADRFQTAAEFKRALQSALPLSQPPKHIGKAIFAAGSLVIVVLAAALMRRGETTPALEPKRVVVAPFVNRTGSANLDELGIMAADWITQGLQATALVDVVPTPTALQSARYVTSVADRDSEVDPIRLLGEETSAGTVISGAFYREDTTLRFQVQVTDVVRGKLLGAPDPVTVAMSAPSTAIEELRTRLMGLLATSFDERLTGFVGEARQPPKYEAYREFAGGMESYVGNRYEEALPRFYRAFELDSTFIGALFFASLNHSNLGDYAKADSLLKKVEPFASRLSAFDRHWLGFRQALMAGDRAAALRSIRLAARTAPASKAVYNLAIEALENGFLGEAQSALEQLVPERGPMRGWIPYWDVRTSILHMRGNHRGELDLARTARRFYPSHQLAAWMEVRALAALGQITEANRRLREMGFATQDPDAWSPSVMREGAEELNAHGQAGAARTINQRLVRWFDERPPAEARKPGHRFGRALTLYALGQYQQARVIADSLAIEYPEDVDYLGLSGLAAARAGDHAKTAQVAERLRLISRPYLFGLNTQYRAFIAAVRGDRSTAVALLRQALAEGRPFDLWLHRHVDLETLRGYLPFEELRQPRD